MAAAAAAATAVEFEVEVEMLMQRVVWCGLCFGGAGGLDVSLPNANNSLE